MKKPYNVKVNHDPQLKKMFNELREKHKGAFGGLLPYPDYLIVCRGKKMAGWWETKRFGGRRITAIKISKYHWEQFGIEDAYDTLLHEMVHHWTFLNYGMHSENHPVFQRKLAEVGGKTHAQRLAQQTFKYTLECPNCGCTTQRSYLRKSTQMMACGVCCRKHNGGKYDPRFKFIIHQNY